MPLGRSRPRARRSRAPPWPRPWAATAARVRDTSSASTRRRPAESNRPPLAVRDNPEVDVPYGEETQEVEVQVTVLVCDVCKRRDVPAKKYLLAVGESEPRR